MSTSEARYVVMTVECQHCKTKQVVHVTARTGAGMIGNQTIPCITCGQYFVAMVPDKIVGGPFPKR
jgi:transcription elongation factor Elf1